MTATLVCFPLDVVRTRLMSKTRGPNYGRGPFNTLAGMLRHEGLGALYTGGTGLAPFLCFTYNYLNNTAGFRVWELYLGGAGGHVQGRSTGGQGAGA